MSDTMNMGLDVLVTGVLILLATVGFVLRVRKLEQKIDAALWRLNDAQKTTRPDIQPWKQLQQELASLRSDVDRIPAETERLITSRLAARQTRETPPPLPPPVSRVPAHDHWEEEPPRIEDGAAHLLTIANGIVQASSTTLDSFRERTDRLGARVSAWPNAGDTYPAAFIVEHRGTCYAVPNTVKPARLPQEWFNRSAFGVNDAIQRVVSLPRLLRRGDRYDVQEPGVFER